MENIPTSKGRLSNGLLEKRHSIRNERNPKNVVEARRGTTTNRADSMPRTSSIPSKRHSLKIFLGFCLFTSLSITIAILIICLTVSPKKDETCPVTYATMPGKLFNQNSRPRSAAFGDLNGDNKLDIVVANSGIDSMAIFFGNGDGTFSNETTYSTGVDSKPYSIAVGYFNEDNHLDIIVANYGTHKIAIFLGYGNGSFTLEVLYSTAVSQPLLVLVNDVNNDDRLDIIVVNYGTNTFGIIFGYKNGTFSEQMLYPTGYDSLPCSGAVGDFNNDTRLDIAIVNCGTYTVSIFLGDGNGLFAPENSYFIGKNSKPYSIAVSHLNEDNKLDIVIGNSGTGTIVILFDYENGIFGNKTTLLTDIYGPQQIVIGDINNDNLEDIIITNNLDDNICIIEGSKDGTFGRQTIYSLSVNSNPSSIIIADLNNDKRKDIVVVNTGVNNIAIMLGYYSVNFLNQTTYPNGIYSPTSVAVGHFNNDSLLDMVVANYGGDSVAILIADSDGGYSLGNVYSTGLFSFPKAVAVADFDNDGRLDIIVTVFSDDIIRIYFGYGDGTFGHRLKYSTGTDSGPQSIAIADLNNDGVLDIVIGNYRSGNIGIFIGIGNGSFTDQTTYTVVGGGASPSSVAIGDFNNDHRLDIVFSAGFDTKLVIFFGLGNGSFVNPIVYSLTYNCGPYSVAVADFNNDTNLDIVVANQNIFSIGIFIGLGNGSFADEKQYLTESRSSPVSIGIADFNNDKILDIVVGHSNSDSIGVFIGIGDGTFKNQKRFSTGNNSAPSVVAFGDMNNDNRLDIVVANYQSSNIGILIGYDDGSIDSPQTYSTGSATNPDSIILGDFNRDNRLDIAVANYGTGTISVLIAYGNLTFAPEINYQTGSNSLPKSIVLADFNNDSALDIAVANFGNDNIGLFFGYPNGTFRNQTTYSTGPNSQPSSVAVSDFNHDKQLDMVIAQSGTDNIAIFLGYKYPDAIQTSFLTGSQLHACFVALADFNSDNLLDIVVVNVTVRNLDVLLAFDNGSFSNPINTETGNGSLFQSIAIGDFNNDNRADIAAINFDGTDIGIFLGYGNGTFAALATYSTGGSTISQWMAVADLNNDNRTDIVVSNTFRQNLGVFIADINGMFSTGVEYSDGDEFIPSPIAIDDFNNDKKLDIIVVNDYPSHRRLEIFLGYGNGMFINTTAYSIPLIVDYTTATLIRVDDFNNDHQRDIVVCYSGADLIGIFIGNGNGTFLPEKTYPLETNSKSQALSIGDFNNDNRLDIVVTLTDINKIGIFLGFGDGTFQMVREYYTGDKSGPFSIGVGDLNDDHVLDIIASNSQSGSIDILFGFYREIFFRQLVYTTDEGSASQSVAVGDFNNDTRQDIVVANPGTDTIGVFIGYGDGTFQNQTTYLTGIGSRPYAVAVGDFNGDNRLDIAVANYDKESVGVFIGYNNGTFASQITFSIGISSRPSSIDVFDLNNDNQLDIVVTDDETSNVVKLVGYGNGSFRLLTKYATGYNSKPCDIAIGDLNNDFETDIMVANCGTNDIGFITKSC